MEKQVKLTPWQIGALRMIAFHEVHVAPGLLTWTDAQHFNHHTMDIPSGQEFQDLGNMRLVSRDDNSVLHITDLGRAALVSPHAPKSASVACELCGGKIVDSQCDTCDSLYDETGKRIPDKYDAPAYFAPEPSAEAVTLTETSSFTLNDLSKQIGPTAKLSGEVIRPWLNEMINGVGGWKSFERYEIVMTNDRDLAIATFILRCLGNSNHPDTQAVIDAIVTKRKNDAELETKGGR